MRPAARSWRLYWRLVGASTRAQMQYKTSFILATVGTFAANIVEFGAVLVLYGRIPDLAGWTFGEVAMLWGMSAISFAIADMFATGFDLLPDSIRLGTFDRVLIRPSAPSSRPWPPGSDAAPLGPRRPGRGRPGHRPEPARPALDARPGGHARRWRWSAARPSSSPSSSLGAAYSFWTVEGREVMNTFTYGGTTMASYPLDIFHDWLRRLVTFIIPLAFVNYYPALYILGRPDPLGLPAGTGWLAPLAAAACCAGAGWRLVGRGAPLPEHRIVIETATQAPPPGARGGPGGAGRRAAQDVPRRPPPPGGARGRAQPVRPAGHRGARRRRRLVPHRAGARWSAASARTGPASRRRSRC